tara:strand:+ start:5379 stop:5957 length:579 start_codon:yes stop_codon:yes gene_type:complete
MSNNSHFEEIDLLNKWINHAAVFKWLHDRSSKYLSKWNKMICIPILIMNTVSGMAIYSANLFKNNNTYFLLFELVIGSLNIICLILSGLKDHCKYGEKTELHIQSYKQWTKFKNDIYVELVVPSTNIKQFVSEMKTRYIDLITMSPYIPNNIIDEYEKEIGINGWTALPDILDGKSNLMTISCGNSHNVVDV